MTVSRTMVVNSSHPELDQVAGELAARGLMSEYIGRYFPSNRVWERALLRFPLTRERFIQGPGRRSAPPGLDPAQQPQAGVALDFAAGLLPIPYLGRPGKALYRSLLLERDRAIIRKALRRWNGADAVTANHSMALELFRRAHAAGRPCILNFPLAHPAYLANVLREESELHPEFAADLMAQGSAQERFDRLQEELDLADSILVGSSFAKQSFVAQGVPSEKIFTSTYGVNVEQFSSAAGRVPDGTFRAIWVGQITQRKGIKYLLEAWRAIMGPGMELVLAGYFMGNAQAYAPYASSYRHAGFLTTQGLRDLFQTADVLVLPSLVEGMPLVVLQAMAARVPVIVTPNGPGDVVRDGVDGFHVPIRNVKAIADKLLYLKDNPEQRRQMGEQAHHRALTFTWARYRNDVADHVERLLMAAT